jgi:Acetyltransferase (GNAT) domain
MRVESFREAEDTDAWDELIQVAPMGTFLHSRRFLSYHGDRFKDASLTVRDDKDRLVGLLPAAVDPDDQKRVTSHPGATYGGLVHTGELYGAGAIEALTMAMQHYAAARFHELRYKPVPGIYHRVPSADDLYALFRLDASRSRCDLSCAIDLANRRPAGSRRRRALNKARRSGVSVEWGSPPAELWPVLEMNLADRHQARPVHTLEEIELLMERFPDVIKVALGKVDGSVVAGLLLFCDAGVMRAQYIAASEEARRVNALDVIFEDCIERALQDGFRFFDFGTSNREEGWVLNEGLYDFKLGFGGGGVAHESYDLELSQTG